MGVCDVISSERDLLDALGQSNGEMSQPILKLEFRNILARIGFALEDAEFDKLWSK